MNTPTPTLRIAVAQTPGRLLDVRGNLEEMVGLCQDAARQGARLALFAEGAITGNAASNRARQASLPMAPASFAPLQHAADRHDITICAGFMTPLDGKLNSACVILGPNRPPRYQLKAFWWRGEPDFLIAAPDPERTLFEVDSVRIAILICSEYGADPVQAALRRAAPQLLLHPSAGSLREDQLTDGRGHASRAAAEHLRLCDDIVHNAAAEAARQSLPKAACNPVGFDGERYWPGNSFAVGADGRVLLWMKTRTNPAEMKSVVEVVDIPVAPDPAQGKETEP